MERAERISVVGLGYVGLPVALAFASVTEVVAYDVDKSRIDQLKKGTDRTGYIPSQIPKTLKLTSQPSDLSDASFHIICVPTPIDTQRNPDLSYLENAAIAVGTQLQPGDTVVVESTVYPGVTEQIVIPILEKESGLKSSRDFNVGYSPERLSPSDTLHLFENTIKLVGANEYEVAERIAERYRQVVLAGVHIVPSIKTAEAAKLLENTQRDVNIALINEMAILFKALNIDSHEVIEAAKTKWNFHYYEPGLVGGHCIGVDPYYMAYIAREHKIEPEVVLAARKRNEAMGPYIAEQLCAALQEVGELSEAKVAIYGLSFKENCPDIRNSKVVTLIDTLRARGVEVYLNDPLVDKQAFENTYGYKVSDREAIPPVHAIVLAVAHDVFVHRSVQEYLSQLQHPHLLVDVKGHLDIATYSDSLVRLWRL